MLKYRTSSHFYRILVFWAGIISTLAYRIIVILNQYSRLWVEIAWYIGTIGFIWYFAHRFRVENKREELIKQRKLGYKIYHKKPLSDDDRDALVYILKGLRSSKARWNYIVIFVLSVIALVYAIINDIMGWLG
jgi:hypothetical protein